MHSAILALILLTAPGAGPANPCTNGSFEELGPQGFPVDWEPVGKAVEVSTDAHSGRRSLRLLRTARTETRLTGLNRTWKAYSGQRGKMIDRLKGGIDFWYKAISAANARLNVYAIPMTADPIEKTGSPRATFTVPRQHIGDGQWHHARLKYDFTDNEKAKWVHFSARIHGTAGELLLDDFAYVERVGPILRFSKVRLDEDPKKRGERCTIVAQVGNAGDAVAEDVRATLQPPPALRATPAELSLGDLAPDAKAEAIWTLDGRREKRGSIGLTAVSGTVQARDSICLAPKIVIESFGPDKPVVAVGQPVRVECHLRNAGNVIVVEPIAEYAYTTWEEGPVRQSREHPEHRIAEETLTLNRLTRPLRSLAPGQTEVTSIGFTPSAETDTFGVSVQVRPAFGDFEGQREARTSFVVVSAARLPRPSGRLRAVSTRKYALLENERLRLAFRHVPSATFGPGELSARTRRGWRTVAWLPRLSRLARRNAEGEVIEHTIFTYEPPEAENGEVARLRFTAMYDNKGLPVCALRTSDKQWSLDARDLAHHPNAAGKLVLTFSLRRRQATIAADYGLVSGRPSDLLMFDGPMLYALDRDEAIFPGLEWLAGDEASSSTLDIAEGHPHQKRFVVHPNMVTIPAIGVHGRHGTVGLLWNIRQKWDGTRDRPSVLFASPDRLNNQRSHLMGLFLPTVPDYVEPNKQQASRPYRLKPDQPIRIRCHIWADGRATDALAAIDEWLRIYGLPKPTPLPHGSYEREIEFSMQAYLKSLWEAETKQWWTSKGGHPLMSRLARPRHYIADLLLGAIVSPDADVRRQCRARAEEVLKIIGGEPRLDAQRFGRRADLAMANPARAAGLLATMGDDGAWRFDADRQDAGVFKGRDYHELGPDNAVEVGTCARKAFEVLRYARIAGDREAYDRMQKTLRLMETFRVPRAAQVWEVPVHTPDLLAAADAVDAYVEAHRFSGEKRWLRNAVTWARRGLPFIYLWSDPEKPWLWGASIPVFGATWYRGSWFGRPVQWNGLRYANALLKLAEYDQSCAWRRIAELIIRSAIHQQDLAGENTALWPDNISAINGRKCPWVFAPRQIIRNILKLTGCDEDPATVILSRRSWLFGRRRRIHVTAAARITDAAWDGRTLSLKAIYPPGEQGVILIANVARPSAVHIDGKPVAERPDVEVGDEAGWRYDPAYAYLSVRVARDAPVVPRLPRPAVPSTIRIEGARFRRVIRLPRLVTRFDFDFDDSLEGWIPAHHVGEVTVRAGVFRGRITGGDPYLVRRLLRVRGDDCPLILIRMQVSAGGGAQFFWTTESSPAFDEAKSLRFPITADDQFHDYRLEPGRHPAWRGQTITAIRIDPTSGAQTGEFAIDHIRGARE